MAVNALSNRISFNPPPEALTATNGAIDVVEQQLVPHLRSLGIEDRRSMPHMGEKSETFVAKALAYAGTHPEFLPGYVDMEEFQRDVDAIVKLRPIRRTLGQLLDMIDDTLALAGSEAYMAALPYYLNAKAAAKLKQPGAAAISDDLSTRFVRQGRPAKISRPASTPSGDGESPVGQD